MCFIDSEGIPRRLRLQGIEAAGGSAEATAAHVPLGRLGQPIDVGRAIRFMLSEEASFITGPNLVVDGGRTSTG